MKIKADNAQKSKKIRFFRFSVLNCQVRLFRASLAEKVSEFSLDTKKKKMQLLLSSIDNKTKAEKVLFCSQVTK